jgi:DNA-directed RNA polymerase specialized sigma24 family protein
MAEAFHRGDEKGLEYFYKTFLPALSLYAFKYVKDRSTAEEIASEAFVKTWKMCWKLDGFGAIRAYLYKIAYRDSMTSLEQKTKKEKSYKDLQPLTTDHYTPFDHLVRSEAYRIIHSVCKKTILFFFCSCLHLKFQQGIT